MTRSSISIEKRNDDVFEVTVVDSITTTYDFFFGSPNLPIRYATTNPTINAHQ